MEDLLFPTIFLGLVGGRSPTNSSHQAKSTSLDGAKVICSLASKCSVSISTSIARLRARAASRHSATDMMGSLVLFVAISVTPVSVRTFDGDPHPADRLIRLIES